MERVVEAARRVLGVCDGALDRDKEGYDIFDASFIRGFFWPEFFGFEGLTPEEIEFMRRKLLRYKAQLKELGFDPTQIDEPVHDVTFLAGAKGWDGRHLRVSPHSLREHFPSVHKQVATCKSHKGGWYNIRIVYQKGEPVKEIWVRFNDLHPDGRTRKWWESDGGD